MMKQKLDWVQYFFFLNIIGLFAIVLLIVYQPPEHPKPEPVISQTEWADSELYIRNVTCPKGENVWRTVSNIEFRDEIIALCENIERFRPIISVDIILGENPDTDPAYPSACLNLWDKSRSYGCMVIFSDVREQLALNYIYRDAPAVSVSTYTIKKEGVYYPMEYETGWYCTMPAADYAVLYDSLQRYGAGELVSEYYK